LKKYLYDALCNMIMKNMHMNAIVMKAGAALKNTGNTSTHTLYTHSTVDKEQSKHKTS